MKKNAIEEKTNFLKSLAYENILRYKSPIFLNEHIHLIRDSDKKFLITKDISIKWTPEASLERIKELKT